MPTKIKGTSGIDKVEAGAVITNPTFSGNATVTGTLTVDSNASINGSNISTQPTFRNLIINGNMQIAQRATSSSSYSTGDTYLTLDRWRSNIVSSGTWTMSQDTDVPTGQGFASSMKWDCTTANASLPTNAFMYATQYFEGQNLQQLKKGTANAESVTLSFWVKSNKTGTYTVFLYDVDNTRLISKAYTVDVADTWEKKTITYAGDTTGALDNNNGRSLDVRFMLAAGTDWSSGTLQTSWAANVTANRAVGQVNLADNTANYINITGVQLEVGDTATDFENLQYTTQLQLCQRYYYATSSAFIAATATTLCYNLQFPVTMRTTPTETHSYVGVANDVYNIITAATPTFVPNGNFPINTGMKFAYDFDAGLTAGQPYQTDFTFSAEL